MIHNYEIEIETVSKETEQLFSDHSIETLQPLFSSQFLTNVLMPLSEKMENRELSPVS